jgi:threonine/homoserine/homoserine lactone efflux protein
MIKHLKLFFWVFLISFLGSLPVGTLNVTAASLYTNNGLVAALEFATGAILVEVLLVPIAIVAVRKLERLKRFYRFFGALSCAILFVFAFLSFRMAFEMQKFQTLLPFATQRPFLSGVFLSSLNPLHLPFWMGWTAVLRSRRIFSDSAKSYNVYILGIGLGTFLAFVSYGLLGNLLVGFLQDKQTALNWVIGVALLGTGVMQCYKTFSGRRKGEMSCNRPKSLNLLDMKGYDGQ